MSPGERLPGGTQLSLPLEVPAAPELRPLVPWESLIADYPTIGLTLGPHPKSQLRAGLPRAPEVALDDLGQPVAWWIPWLEFLRQSAAHGGTG